MLIEMMGQGRDRAPGEGTEAEAGARTGVRRRMVLLVEDNAADVLLVRDAIERYQLPVQLCVVEDGEKACEFFEKAELDPTAPQAEILVLDLNLPKKSGKEVLQRVRQSRTFKGIPVLIVTSSDLSYEREELLALGANRYFRKPSNYEQFLKVGELLKDIMEAPPAS